MGKKSKKGSVIIYRRRRDDGKYEERPMKWVRRPPSQKRMYSPVEMAHRVFNKKS